jgi:hypothetical protein
MQHLVSPLLNMSPRNAFLFSFHIIITQYYLLHVSILPGPSSVRNQIQEKVCIKGSKHVGDNNM